MLKTWIFSNRAIGEYGDSIWDTSTILKTKRYYFNHYVGNLTKVKQGDFVYLREYGTGFWGTCKIAGNIKKEKDCGKDIYSFPIGRVENWPLNLPYDIIRHELSNNDHRSRIASLTVDDRKKIEFARIIFDNSTNFLQKNLWRIWNSWPGSA